MSELAKALVAAQRAVNGGVVEFAHAVARIGGAAKARELLKVIEALT